MGFFDDALSTMGQSLAQSASGYVQGVTGPVVGNMLSTLFGGEQSTGGANLVQLQTDVQSANLKASDIALLNGQLAAQTTEIQNIGTQLTALSSAVALIQSQVQAMKMVLGKIAQAQLFQAWQAVDIEMTTAINKIHSDYSILSGFTANYANTSGSQVKSVMEELQVNGPLDAMNLINAFILNGGGQSQGVLQLWSAMVAPLVQNGLMDYREAVDQYTAYYMKLVSAQLLAANLLVEVSNYFAINDDHTAAMSAWSGYKTCVLSQEAEFIHWLVPLVYSGVMAYAAVIPPYISGPGYTYYEAAMQLHPGLQAMPGDAGGEGYYAPTSIFENAEAMLATLSVTDPHDRRLVVHMVFSDDQYGTFKTPIDANPITLTFSGSSTVTPTHVSKFGYTGFPVLLPTGTPDQNFFNGQYMHLYRHVYAQDKNNPTALQDGSYQLTNLNGKLPAMQTYAAGNERPPAPAVSFQETKILSYLLNVSSTSKFDFMNFGAYMVSQV